MNQPDWSKAPEWAGVYLRNACDGSLYAWAESYQENARFQRAGSPYSFTALSVGCWTQVAMRPVTTEWNGTGLPTVGVVCEIEHHREWVRCEILAHKTFSDLPGLVHAIAWIDKDTVDQSSGIRFRPIRTPEQIATDEREAAIEEMYQIYKNSPGLATQQGMAALYDHGYRKQSTCDPTGCDD